MERRRVEYKYVDSGVAWTRTNGGVATIYINRMFIRYPDVYDVLVKHELKHCQARNIFVDMWIDLKDMFNLDDEVVVRRVMVENPLVEWGNDRSLISKVDGVWYFNWSVFFVYAFLIVIIVLIVLVFYGVLMYG